MSDRTHSAATPTATSKESWAFATAQIRLRAREHMRIGDYAAAAHALQAVVDARPDDLEATLALALAHSRSGRPVMVARTYLHAAELHARGRRTRLAHRFFDRALSLDPTQVVSRRVTVWARALGAQSIARLRSAAQRHASSGCLTEARALLELAADVQPVDVDVLEQLLRLRARLGTVEDLLARLHETAETLNARGRRKALVRLATFMLEFFPTDPVALRSLAAACVAVGDAEGALPYLLRLQQHHAVAPSALVDVARIQATRGDHGAAIHALRRYVWVRSVAGPSGAHTDIEAVLSSAQRWRPHDPAWQDALISVGFGAVVDTPVDLGGAELVMLPTEPPPPPLRTASAPRLRRPSRATPPRRNFITSGRGRTSAFGQISSAAVGQAPG